MRKNSMLMLLVGLFVMVFSMPVFAESQRWSYYQPTITNDTVPAANAGDTEAMLNIGIHLMHTDSRDAALKWFVRAAKAGNPQGSYFCGLWALDAADKENSDVEKNECYKLAITFFKVAAHTGGNAAAYGHLGILYKDCYNDNENAAIAWINAYTGGVEGAAKLLYDISNTSKTANSFLKAKGLKCKDFVAEEAAPPATVGASAKVVEQSKQVPVVKKAPGVFKFPGKDEVFEIELRNGRKIPGKVKDIVENKVYFELGEGAVTIYKQENIAMSSRCRLFKEDFLNQAQ